MAQRQEQRREQTTMTHVEEDFAGYGIRGARLRGEFAGKATGMKDLQALVSPLYCSISSHVVPSDALLSHSLPATHPTGPVRGFAALSLLPGMTRPAGLSPKARAQRRPPAASRLRPSGVWLACISSRVLRPRMMLCTLVAARSSGLGGAIAS
eukprot:6185508-Pleurochrysis_carterae.AAC.2